MILVNISIDYVGKEFALENLGLISYMRVDYKLN